MLLLLISIAELTAFEMQQIKKALPVQNNASSNIHLKFNSFALLRFQTLCFQMSQLFIDSIRTKKSDEQTGNQK